MAYVERERHSKHRQVFCDDAVCWQRYEAYNCDCPDYGSLHSTAEGKPCPELEVIAVPRNLIGAVRCTNCGLEVS